VAKGFTQIYGVDYYETFSCVVKLNSIKVLLALATKYDLECHQLDVKTTFLNGNIEEDIYMYIPEGLLANPKLVCKLIKSLYGLKQSSTTWYIHFDAYLIVQGYHQLEANANIYIKNESDNGFTIIIVYVDDFLVISNKPFLIQFIKSILQQEFEMSDEGQIQEMPLYGTCKKVEQSFTNQNT